MPTETLIHVTEKGKNSNMGVSRNNAGYEVSLQILLRAFCWLVIKAYGVCDCVDLLGMHARGSTYDVGCELRCIFFANFTTGSKTANATMLQTLHDGFGRYLQAKEHKQQQAALH